MTRPRVDPANRQRTEHACNSCKKRKQKCDGIQPCTACMKRGVPCVYAIGSKILGFRQASSSQYSGSQAGGSQNSDQSPLTILSKKRPRDSQSSESSSESRTGHDTYLGTGYQISDQFPLRLPLEKRRRENQSSNGSPESKNGAEKYIRADYQSSDAASSEDQPTPPNYTMPGTNISDSYEYGPLLDNNMSRSNIYQPDPVNNMWPLGAAVEGISRSTIDMVLDMMPTGTLEASAAESPEVTGANSQGYYSSAQPSIPAQPIQPSYLAVPGISSTHFEQFNMHQPSIFQAGMGELQRAFGQNGEPTSYFPPFSQQPNLPTPDDQAVNNHSQPITNQFDSEYARMHPFEPLPGAWNDMPQLLPEGPQWHDPSWGDEPDYFN